MKYFLILISLSNSNVNVEQVQTFDTMNECFEGRELLVEVIGRPIINYQAVCIIQE